MQTYKEYPIRCKSCNEQIACFSKRYEQLVRKYTTKAGVTGSLAIEQALNEMKILEPCCRMAFMNPITVFFNVEDRGLIEGTRDIDILIPNRKKILPKVNLKANLLEYNKTTSSSSTTIEDRLRIISEEELQQREEDEAGATLSTEFVYPTVVGIPTINPIFGIGDDFVSAGTANRVKVLNGRTYLAR